MTWAPRYKRLIGTVVGHNDHFDRLRYNHFRLSYQTGTVKCVFVLFVAQTIWIRSNSSVSVAECIVRARDPPVRQVRVRASLEVRKRVHRHPHLQETQVACRVLDRNWNLS
jgi:hypothetical protein